MGGCDILLEMHKNGDLVEELEKIGIISKLAEEKKWILSREKDIKNTNAWTETKELIVSQAPADWHIW